MEDLAVNAGLVIPGNELSWTAARSSGPGGQNVNKVSTKVELRFDWAASTVLAEGVKVRLSILAQRHFDAEGRILVTAQSTRFQIRNLELARDKLCALIRAALVVPRKRRPTAPTRGSKAKRLRQKHLLGSKKLLRGRVGSDD